ncbi:TlpA family protein disulfide reductase [Cellulophaga sp. 20_2_10]|uniref:TlpA family protein disulfide reductase n=1 Tax=Cellulophaga sp. 20_2_10 TaxID=2942476 RepID=UPI00201A48B3|nr:TlpA disulfide reductase family protein [Cellulophaga sp. 20_2_10]MCL5246127.1 TlpA family protein disulfide reductase [Cellulophaga sp. 20_2_10]
MKNILGLLALTVLFTSCKDKVETPIDYAILSGKITNSNGDFTLSNPADRSFKYSIKLADDGSFLDTLRLDDAVYMMFKDSNVTKLYIEQGSNIIVSADASKFDETLSFKGKGAEASTYITAKEKTRSELTGDQKSFFALEEPSFKAKVIEVESTLTKLLSETKGISEKFAANEKLDLHYEYLSSLNNYSNYHAFYAEKPDYVASESLLAELKNIDYDNKEHYLASSNYKQLVNGHIMEEAQKIMKRDSISFDMANVVAAAEVKDNYIKNDLLFKAANTGITFTGDVKKYYDFFMKESTNDEHKKILTAKYNELKTIAPGQPSPKFVDYENYAGGTTSLDDLKGKYVYIDVWATWCGPCKAEIPFLQKVEKEYHGKNIEFVSISVDNKEDHDKWKSMVKDEELGGTQLFTGDAFKTKFIEDYFVMGIPKFILLDPNGNIVNSSAPRPSDSKLIDLFNQLEI